MADKGQVFHIQELPWHLIMEVLTSGRLSAADLARLEMTCHMFGARHELCPEKFRSVAEYAAYCLCHAHQVFAFMPVGAKWGLLGRCGGNWKKVLRFLQLIEQSSGTVETSVGKMQVDTGKYHTLLIHNSSLYSCGSNLCGVLGHGHHMTQCATFSRVNFPSLSPVVHVSASHNHAAFVTQSGEVFTCGDNSSFCCGHGDIGRTVFRPTRIEALRGFPFVLTDEGSVFAFGWMGFGSLGFSDRSIIDKVLKPRALDSLWGHSISQISTGLYHTVAVTNKGLVFGFGDNERAQLGHEWLRGCLQPTEIMVQRMVDGMAVACDCSSILFHRCMLVSTRNRFL